MLGKPDWSYELEARVVRFKQFYKPQTKTPHIFTECGRGIERERGGRERDKCLVYIIHQAMNNLTMIC